MANEKSNQEQAVEKSEYQKFYAELTKLFRAKKNKDAVKLLEKNFKRFPEKTVAMSFNLAYLCGQTNNLKKGIKYLQKAHKKGCQMLIVHHGFWWKYQKDPLHLREKYHKLLKKYNLNLCGYHLPLDAHKTYGNNIQICKVLGLKHIKPFGEYHGPTIGFCGSFPKALSWNAFIALIKKKINPKIKAVHYGKEKIQKVGVVSGGAGKMFVEAVQKKMDAYITGELGHSGSNMVQGAQFNAIEAGH